MKTSNLYSLDWRDLVKGLVVAVLTPCFVIIQNSIDAGQLIFNWKQLAMAAVGGLVAYLMKNFFTPSQIITPVK